MYLRYRTVWWIASTCSWTSTLLFANESDIKFRIEGTKDVTAHLMYLCGGHIYNKGIIPKRFYFKSWAIECPIDRIRTFPMFSKDFIHPTRLKKHEHLLMFYRDTFITLWEKETQITFEIILFPPGFVIRVTRTRIHFPGSTNTLLTCLSIYLFLCDASNITISPDGGASWLRFTL